jgi:structural maintenance of chromosome 4
VVVCRRVAELKKELPRSRDEQDKAISNLETERAELARVNQRVAKLRTELQGLRNSKDRMQSRNQVVAALMDQKNKGNIPGIFGRLGDLGAIDVKYDCAISSSCSALEHIVVDKASSNQVLSHVKVTFCMAIFMYVKLVQ